MKRSLLGHLHRMLDVTSEAILRWIHGNCLLGQGFAAKGTRFCRTKPWLAVVSLSSEKEGKIGIGGY